MLIYSVGDHILWVVSIVGSDLWWIKKWKILFPAFYYIPLEYILDLSVTSITYIYMSKFLTGPYVYLLVVLSVCLMILICYTWVYICGHLQLLFITHDDGLWLILNCAIYISTHRNVHDVFPIDRKGPERIWGCWIGCVWCSGGCILG